MATASTFSYISLQAAENLLNGIERMVGIAYFTLIIKQIIVHG
jgi:hypothetical protein